MCECCDECDLFCIWLVVYDVDFGMWVVICEFFEVYCVCDDVFVDFG